MYGVCGRLNWKCRVAGMLGDAGNVNHNKTMFLSLCRFSSSAGEKQVGSLKPPENFMRDLDN